jgi:hypothetical protein
MSTNDSKLVKHARDTMTLGDLIQELDYIADDYGEDMPVYLAEQPGYPFMYSVRNVAIVTDYDEDEDDQDENDDDKYDDKNVRGMAVFIGEGSQLAYLPKFVSDEIGW